MGTGKDTGTLGPVRGEAVSGPKQAPQYDFRQTHNKIEQALSQSCFQKQEQSYCHLVFLHGSGAGSLKPLIHEDAKDFRL